MSNVRFRAVQIGRVAPGVWRAAVRGPLDARPYILHKDHPTWAAARAWALAQLAERYGVTP